MEDGSGSERANGANCDRGTLGLGWASQFADGGKRKEVRGQKLKLTGDRPAITRQVLYPKFLLANFGDRGAGMASLRCSSFCTRAPIES